MIIYKICYFVIYFIIQIINKFSISGLSYNGFITLTIKWNKALNYSICLENG